MGLFDLFKTKPKFRDELFGEMDYITVKDPTKNFYSGKVNFNSLKIEIIITTDESGPTKEQKDFFMDLQSNYSTVFKNNIESFLKTELADWLEENHVADLETELVLNAVSIPKLPATPILWSITYFVKNADHSITVDLKDFEPQEMCIDG